MYLYSSLVFPDDYTYILRNMTAERAYAVKNALKGSLSIGRYEGEGNPPRFPMSAYARDAAAFLMKSLQSYISFKASLVGIHPSNVSITFNDRQALADTVSNVSLLGVTGFINFTYDKRRVMKTLVIRNFINNNSVEFTKSNANVVNPWSVEKRAYFTSGTGRLQYVYGNGTEAQHVTIMFSDGTNRIPSYTIQKAYRRGEFGMLDLNACMKLSLTTFLLPFENQLSFIYLVCVSAFRASYICGSAFDKHWSPHSFCSNLYSFPKRSRTELCS